MARPNVTIRFANGALGSVAASADGVAGIVVSGAAVAGKLETGKPYVLYSPDNLDALGVGEESGDPNRYLAQCVRQFYAEAGNGAELWLLVVPANTAVAAMLGDSAKTLLRAAKGRVRLVAALKPADPQAELEDGLAGDMPVAIAAAQTLGEWATETLYAPVAVLLEGRNYADANAASLADLGEGESNRVGVVLGQVIESGAAAGSLVALVAGRCARIPVQRHIGRVRDGALALGSATLTIDGTVAVENADLDTPNNRGYIVPCTHVGRSGYYLCDDHLATATGDDYHSLARRRVVDKAYRIAYDTLLDYLKDEVACNGDGTIAAAVAKAWEADVVAAIAGQMTAAGELGNDPADPKDKGVKCSVDRRQNVVATGKVLLSIGVKPYGYARYIEATLGFTAER